MANLLIFFIGSVSFLMGLLFAYLAVRDYRLGKNSEQWPTIEGVVMFSILESHSDGEGTSHKPRIFYSYELDNVSYFSDRIKVDTSWGSKKGAIETLAKYPRGSKVTVHYHPGRLALSLGGYDPRRLKYVPRAFTPIVPMIDWIIEHDAKRGNSVLEPGASFSWFLFTLTIGLSAILLGLFFLLVA
ncbi:MAG: DUF3592 domain-containing protein [Candidatus Odinarchaeota archaeon]